jgi:hypothetical protein
LHGFLVTELGVRTEIEAMRRSPANLTQLVGFLAGCVYGEVTGVRHVVKRTLADRLKVRLGAASLAGNSAADLRKLAVTAIAI